MENRAPGRFRFQVERLPWILGASRTVSGAVLARLGSQVEPSWRPKLRQNREKIIAKMHLKIDTFQERFLMRCWSVWGGKMEASWHQHRMKNGCELREARFKKKPCFYMGKTMILKVRKVNKSMKNASKID